MKINAAILWEPKTDWSVEEVELDPPKAGEVLLKLVGSGLCHSDEHLVTGDMTLDPAVATELGVQQFPIIGGHEGAGEVVEVGPGVTSVAPGDQLKFVKVTAPLLIRDSTSGVNSDRSGRPPLGCGG